MVLVKKNHPSLYFSIALYFWSLPSPLLYINLYFLVMVYLLKKTLTTVSITLWNSWFTCITCIKTFKGSPKWTYIQATVICNTRVVNEVCINIAINYSVWNHRFNSLVVPDSFIVHCCTAVMKLLIKMLLYSLLLIIKK